MTALVLLHVFQIALAPDARAQGVPILQTPAERFQPPALEPDETKVDRRILPPIPEAAEARRPDSGLRVRVDRYRFEGNTVFTDAQLAAVVAPYVGRAIATEQLQAARDAVTRHYVDAGYVTSGAVLPDQDGANATVILRLVEGRLVDVRVEGALWHRESYFSRRLMLGADQPLRIDHLEQRLQRLQESDGVERIAARLEPGERRGESVLLLRVAEADPIDVSIAWGNDLPVTLGEQNGRFDLRWSNLLGLADSLEVGGTVSGGVREGVFAYRVPVTVWDTELSAYVRRSRGRIVEDVPAARGDFQSKILTVGFGIAQPLWRSRTNLARVSIAGEWRRSKATAGGVGISFPGSGADLQTGITRISALRIGGEWIHRQAARVFALRQLVSVGLPILKATDNDGSLPDSDYVSFLTQARFGMLFARLPGSELVARADLQWSPDPLVPMEQIGVGGFATVRGYAENELVRDSALIASFEARLPLYRSPTGRHLVQIAPFVDVGHAWSEDRSEGNLGTETLASTGIGLRYRTLRFLSAEVYWGAALHDRIGKRRGIQGHGVSFRVRWEVF